MYKNIFSLKDLFISLWQRYVGHTNQTLTNKRRKGTSRSCEQIVLLFWTCLLLFRQSLSHKNYCVSGDGGDKWQPRGWKIFLPSPLSVSPDKITASILKLNRHHSVVSFQIFLDEHPLGKLSHSDVPHENNQTMRISNDPSPQNTFRAFCFSKAWYTNLCTVHTYISNKKM